MFKFVERSIANALEAIAMREPVESRDFWNLMEFCDGYTLPLFLWEPFEQALKSFWRSLAYRYSENEGLIALEIADKTHPNNEGDPFEFNVPCWRFQFQRGYIAMPNIGL